MVKAKSFKLVPVHQEAPYYTISCLLLIIGRLWVLLRVDEVQRIHRLGKSPLVKI
jgi:hypothetical protein